MSELQRDPHYHLRDRSLQCHYCDYRIQAPEIVRSVRATTSRMGLDRTPGAGDQIVIPRDTSGKDGSRHHLSAKISSADSKKLENGSIDICGTQMIVKGHDFPNVTLWGVCRHVLHFLTSIQWEDLSASHQVRERQEEGSFRRSGDPDL